MRRGRYVENEDWDRASQVVGDVYFPHRLRVLGPGSPRVLLSTVELGPVLLGHVGWGVDVAISCDYPSAYEVNLPLTGHLEVHGPAGPITALPHRTAAVFAADRTTEITAWDATCQLLGVKFDRRWLEREADQVLDRPVTGRLDLPGALDVTTPNGAAWAALVTGLSSQLARPSGLLQNEVVTRQLAGALAAGFLLAVDAEDHLRGLRGAPLRPRIVKRVLDALHDDPARSWTASEMAHLAGVSVRRLQEGFQQHVGATPRQCLLDIRLDRARSELLSDPRATVSDVAARWGFSSASRLAAAYRARYGVRPSDDR